MTSSNDITARYTYGIVNLGLIGSINCYIENISIHWIYIHYIWRDHLNSPAQYIPLSPVSVLLYPFAHVQFQLPGVLWHVAELPSPSQE